jgi:hypothetical protein
MSASLYPGWQVVQWTPPAHSEDGKGVIKRYVGSPHPTRAGAEAKLRAVSMFSVFPAFKNHFTIIEINVEQRVYESWQRKGLVQKTESVLPTVAPLVEGASSPKE